MANRDTHGSNEEEWVGFDLDGTLAKYDGWKGVEHIGKPVPAMVVLAYMLHKFGRKVKILTARVAPRDGDDGSNARKYVQEWCRDYLGFVPEVTHLKDASMVALFDDRACAVEQNTGKVLGGWPDFLPEPSKKAQKAILDKMPESEKKTAAELVRVKKPLTIHDRLVRCVMRRNPGFSEEDAEEYISDGRLDAEIAKAR